MPKPRGNVKKSVKPKLYIYCEGEKTEPNYIRAYIGFSFPGVKILENSVKLVPSNKNTPVALVAEALQHKNSTETLDKDIFWVVYDRESEAKYSDALHQQALDNAKSHVINVALSNVCFEFWVLLHFCNSSMAAEKCDDIINDARFRSVLAKAGVSEYKKNDAQVARVIVQHIDPTKR